MSGTARVSCSFPTALDRKGRLTGRCSVERQVEEDKTPLSAERRWLECCRRRRQRAEHCRMMDVEEEGCDRKDDLLIYAQNQRLRKPTEAVTKSVKRPTNRFYYGEEAARGVCGAAKALPSAANHMHKQEEDTSDGAIIADRGIS
ncbi:hypothetical protein KC321_g46 [Hortaea werneckii]|nr:hypothetical protein KC321_g46 [Hortaea werneckii]